MKNVTSRAFLFLIGLFFASFATAELVAETALSPAASLADHLQRVERQADRLERQIAHLRGRPEAAADLELLVAHLERLQPATAALGPEAGTALEERRAALLDRLRHGDRRREAPTVGAGSGSISGVVTVSGGQPLADIPVVAYRVGAGFATVDYTDGSGSYQLSGLGDGSYHVATDFAIHSTPYLNETYDDVHCQADGPCNTASATTVTIVGGAAVNQIDFALSAGGKLRGRVLDQDGMPVEGAAVTAYDRRGQQVANRSTDVIGRYTVDRLLPGFYHLRASSYRHVDELYPDVPCEGGACGFSGGVAVAVGLDSQVTGLDFSLERLNSLRGQVIDTATEAPLGYADVRVQTPDGSVSRWITANSQGEWEAADLPAGTYVAYASDYDYQSELYRGIPCSGVCHPLLGTPIMLADGASLEGIDFSLARLGAISGTLKAADTLEPLSERVEVYDQVGWYVASAYGGPFLVSGLDSGTYFVRTDAFGSEYRDELWQDIPCAPGCTVTDGDPVAVTVGETTKEIDFLLERLGRIEGRVVASSGGAPLAGIYVAAYQVASGDWVSSDSTDPQGFFRLYGLADGNYKVTAGSDEYRAEIWDGIPCTGACNPANGQSIAVSLGQTATGIDFALERLGYLGGTVRDQASQEPLQGMRVEIYDGGGFFRGSYYTDFQGAFTTGGLADGNYFAAVYNFSGNEYLSEIYSGIDCGHQCPAITGGTAIPVSVGTSRLDIDFSLLEGGSIEGLVVAANSLAPAFGSVTAYDEAGQAVATAAIGNDGRYTLIGLGAGNYFLKADPSSVELTTEVWPNVFCLPNAACNPLAGSAVAVTLGSATTANFALDPLGRIAGSVIDAETGAPVGGGSVTAYLADGSYQGFTWVDAAGGYLFVGLRPGVYKLTTENNYRHIERVLGGANCETGGCNLATGSDVPVQMGQSVAPPDLPLAFGPGLAGWIRQEGSPAANVGIDVWTQSGFHIATVASSAAGRFRVALPGGDSYFLSTDGGAAFIDEVFEDIPCPLGPAYLGMCDPLAGDPLGVPYGQPAADGILFDIESRTALFRDGFESGNFGAWSLATGD